MSLLKSKKSKKKVKKENSVTPVETKDETSSNPVESKKDKKTKKEKKSKKAKKTTTGDGEKKTRKPRGNNKMSCIAAAEAVLKKKGNKPMTSMELIEGMTKAGLWKTPGGKTPDRTLNSAILREIAENGKKSKFVKADRGQYQLRG